jgi:hypothetical protein
MKNSQWGPAAWLFLHSVTFQYPENPTDQDKNNYKIFFDSLQNILPCPNCREHYQKNLKENPMNLESRESLIKWVIDLHNAVNKKNSKKEYSYDEVNDLYQSKYNYSIKENESVESNMKFVLILILMILLIFYFLKK